MMALLLIAGDQQWAAFETIRRATFVTIGLAPIAFLVGLLSSRLARSDVGDLLVQLRSEPQPGELRDALAGALRDPSLSLAFWLPEFAVWADPNGRETTLPEPGSGRSARLIENERPAGRRLDPRPVARRRAGAARRGQRRRRDRPRERPPAGRAPRPPRGAARVAGEGARGRAGRATPPRARPPRRGAAAADLAVARSQAPRGSARRRPRRPRTDRPGAGRDRHLAAGAADDRQRPAPGGGQRARSAGRARHPGGRRRRAGHPGRPISTGGSTRRSRSPPTTSSPRASRTSASTRRRARRRFRSRAKTGPWWSRSPTTGSAAPTASGGTGLRGLADRVEAHGGRLRVWTPRGGGTRVRAEIPCG